MAKFASIIYLKETIPEDAWSWVIPALRQDSLIWKSLQNPEFLKLVIQQIGSDPHRWTPLNIALVSLGIDLEIDDLGRMPLQELSPYLYQQAKQVYENHTSEESFEIDIKSSGLLALYYLEHEEEAKITAPKTSLACLYSLLENPVELLIELSPKIAVHVVLSNPLQPVEQVDIFSKYLSQAEPQFRLSIFKHLSFMRPRIATLVAGEIIKSYPDAIPSIDNYDVLNSRLFNLAQSIIRSEVLSLANQEEGFQNLINQALEKTEEIQAELTTRLIEKEIISGKIEQAYSQWNHIKLLSTPLQAANVFLSLIDHYDDNETTKWFRNEFMDGEVIAPETFLARGYLSHLENDDEKAMISVLKSVEGFSTKEEPKIKHLQQLTQLALDLNLYDAASETINRALDLNPNDVESLRLMRVCHQATDQQDDAIDAAHIAVALAPERLDLYRDLAKALEISKQWVHAMHVRGKIMTRHESLAKEEAYQDAFLFASCSLKSNHPQNTAGICQKLLKEKPDDPETHHLLGQTYISMGDHKKALVHFTQATRLAPDAAKSWLALAEVYQDSGQKSKQKETLQTAANIITNNPEIFLALGQIYLGEDSPTQALQNFRIANSLANSGAKTIQRQIKAKAALLLGNTLYQLGHTFDARVVLEEAYKANKEHMGIAHAYARTLLATKSPEDALPILENTRQIVPNSLDINLDYVRACLATSSNLDEIKNTLLEILKSQPDHSEAKALLAETYEATRDFDLAIQTYQEVLSSSLQDDPGWLTRLTLGLSRIYLEKNQPENAIAILNNALQKTNDEEKILKSLSDAYSSANLREKAIWAAKSVLSVKPDDEETLDWFIQKAIDIGAITKAIDVLEETSKKSPSTASYLIKLGWLYLYQGDIDKARQTFIKIKGLDQISSNELYQASQGMIAVDDMETAIDLIEKAIHLSGSTGDDALIPKLFSTKVYAYQKVADLKHALQALEDAIEYSPNDPTLIQKKAGILLDLQSYSEAIACIENGLDTFPENTNLHLQAAIIFRANGQLLEAADHAKKVVRLYREKDDDFFDVFAATILADLANAMMQTGMAEEMINWAASKLTFNQPDSLHFHCLRGEIALASEDKMLAADSLTKAIEINPNHPRTLALQARLTSRQEGHDQAEIILQKALKAAGTYAGTQKYQVITNDKYLFSEHEFPISTYLALAETSIEFNQWQVVNVLIQKVLNLGPEEPQSHYQFARFLVLRAENQRLCDVVHAVKHAPGKSSLAQYAYKEFENAILRASHIIARYSQSASGTDWNFEKAKEKIAVWLARGQAVFHPSSEHAIAVKKLPEIPDNLAALLSTLRECGEMETAWKIAQEIQAKSNQDDINAKLLGQIALAIAGREPDAALLVSENAIEVSKWQNLPDKPLFNALHALIAERKKDIVLQRQALQDALEIWQDEPIWLSMVADLYLQSDKTNEIKEAITYLESATYLEPKKVEHYLKLGKVHQRLGNPKGAIVVLDQATRVISKQPEPWLALAKAHYANDEIPQAIRCAKTVTQIDPRGYDAQLLLAEISLEVNNPQKAARYIEEVLHDQPENHEALLLSSKIYSALNDPEKALDSLERAMPWMPDSIPLQLRRAQLIQVTHSTKDSLDILKGLAEKYPRNSQVLAALAELYSVLNEPENAILNAQAALNSVEGNLNKEEHLRTLTLLGRLLRKTGQLDQSIHYLNEAIEEDPKAANPYIELGRCYQEQRLYDRALQHFQNAIQLSPEDYQPYYLAGLVLKEIKDFVNAERMFKSATKLAPKNMNIYRQLAAVTAINFVQNHQSRSETDSELSMTVPMERIEK